MTFLATASTGLAGGAGAGAGAGGAFFASTGLTFLAGGAGGGGGGGVGAGAFLTALTGAAGTGAGGGGGGTTAATFLALDGLYSSPKSKSYAVDLNRTVFDKGACTANCLGWIGVNPVVTPGATTARTARVENRMAFFLGVGDSNDVAVNSRRGISCQLEAATAAVVAGRGGRG